MAQLEPAQHAQARAHSPWRWLAAALAVTVLTAAILLAYSLRPAGTSVPAASSSGEPAASVTPTTAPEPSESPAPPESDPAAELLETTLDPAACAVSFAGEGISVNPVLETSGTLFRNLPIPLEDGTVFAGWYATEKAAADLDHTERMNGARTVACDDQQLTLYGARVSPERNREENAQVPVLMYHWFTTNPGGEDHWLKGNFVFVDDFESHLKYISEERFYLPTWPELNAFIDGELFLPDKSVIVTDDDAKQSWLDLAAPLVEKYQVMTTSFIIGAKGAGPDLSPWVLKRSHTYDMHSAGADGQGRMVNWTVEEVVADLDKSAEMLGGAREVLAYPFGHYNDTAKEALRQAGFDLARTTEHGYVSIGTEKLALPCIRIDYGMGVDALQGLIG